MSYVMSDLQTTDPSDGRLYTQPGGGRRCQRFQAAETTQERSRPHCYVAIARAPRDTPGELGGLCARRSTIRYNLPWATEFCAAETPDEVPHAARRSTRHTSSSPLSPPSHPRGQTLVAFFPSFKFLFFPSLFPLDQVMCVCGAVTLKCEHIEWPACADEQRQTSKHLDCGPPKLPRDSLAREHHHVKVEESWRPPRECFDGL